MAYFTPNTLPCGVNSNPVSGILMPEPFQGFECRYCLNSDPSTTLCGREYFQCIAGTMVSKGLHDLDGMLLDPSTYTKKGKGLGPSDHGSPIDPQGPGIAILEKIDTGTLECAGNCYKYTDEDGSYCYFKFCDITSIGMQKDGCLVITNSSREQSLIDPSILQDSSVEEFIAKWKECEGSSQESPMEGEICLEILDKIDTGSIETEGNCYKYIDENGSPCYFKFCDIASIEIQKDGCLLITNSNCDCALIDPSILQSLSAEEFIAKWKECDASDSTMLVETQIACFEANSPIDSTIEEQIEEAISGSNPEFDFDGKKVPATIEDVSSFNITASGCAMLIQSKPLEYYEDGNEGGVTIDVPIVAEDSGKLTFSICFSKKLKGSEIAEL